MRRTNHREVHHGSSVRPHHLATSHRVPLRKVGHVAAACFIAATVAACSAPSPVVVTTTVTSSRHSRFDTTPAPESVTARADGAGTSSSGSGTSSTATTGTATTGTTTPTTSTTTTATTSTAPAKPVHVSTFEGDGKTYGVGMAVMVLFSKSPTDATAFDKAATVTVNGSPADGKWFWQQPSIPGYTMEALYREKGFWPAHSDIHVDLPVKGLSAGAGLVYDDDLTADFRIGAEHISHVSNKNHQMTVTSDGKVVKNFPVSLGSATTPTYDGTKIVMAKGSVNPKTGKARPDGKVEMKSDPGEADPYDIMVPWSVRITNSGEFVHAASWNTGNIGSRNTSHGCTNLNVDDAKWFYRFSQIGDVVEYQDANPKDQVQPSWDGWGWWNLSWDEWQTGGTVPTQSA